MFRLTSFAIVLALVFAAAAFAGSRVDVHPGRTEPEVHGSMLVRGLAVSDGGLTLELARSGRPLSFRITRDGKPVRDFDVKHTKRMHVIVVRRDLTGFQHLHPTMRADGTWTAPLTLGGAGVYRVYADFAVDGEPHTLAADLMADGEVRSQPLPPVSNTATVDGLTVRRRGLDFTVTRAGKPVAIEDYLGAKGHLVALREGDLAFLHVHPDENRLRFEADLDTLHRYRLFLQFKTGGRVHTAAFTR
jgi:hypothetical protein